MDRPLLLVRVSGPATRAGVGAIADGETLNAFVITIQSHAKSIAAAERCIESAADFGVAVDEFPAFVPSDDPLDLLRKEGIPPEGFQEKWSRYLNCVSAFLSHHALWKQCARDDQPLLIFEHDAIVVGELPLEVQFDRLLSLGKPSYGDFLTPSKPGVNPLTSKPYFPGAHAYMIKPSGARALIERAKLGAKTTDVFLHVDTFPWLQEYHPWPVEARDSFTTIQNQTGCLAKHNYGSTYEIARV